MSASNCNNNSYDKKAADVVDFVDDLLEKAITSGASDIHFEPTHADLVVKYRLDGVLSTVDKLPKSLSDNVIARLKVLGGLLTYRNDIPQEGRIELEKIHSDKKVIDQRLAIFPTINGQRAVVRLFYQDKGLTQLEQLGFSENQWVTKPFLNDLADPAKVEFADKHYTIDVRPHCPVEFPLPDEGALVSEKTAPLRIGDDIPKARRAGFKATSELVLYAVFTLV